MSELRKVQKWNDYLGFIKNVLHTLEKDYSNESAFLKEIIQSEMERQYKYKAIEKSQRRCIHKNTEKIGTQKICDDCGKLINGR